MTQTKPKPSEIPPVDEAALRRADETMRRMLAMPPDAKKAKKKEAKRAK